MEAARRRPRRRPGILLNPAANGLPVANRLRHAAVSRSRRRFSSKLPYVGEYRVISKLDERHDTLYTRLKFPIIDDRDYFIDSELVSDLAADGSGTYHKAFKLSATPRPARVGIVRIPVCEGSWSLTASPNEGKTSATYHLLTDPGGWLPSSLTNLANRRAVPDLVRSLHGEMKRRAGLKATLAAEAGAPANAAAARQ